MAADAAIYIIGVARLMRLGRFNEGGPKACLRHEDRAVDLSRVEPESDDDLLKMLGNRDIMRRLSLLERGQPPQEARRHTEKLQWLSCVEPKRMLLRGGANEDVAPKTVVAYGAELPSGTWHTGVAAVVGRNKKVAGFTVFHRVGDTVSLGPWLITPEEAGDPLGFLFSAFVDDLPSIRPVKALLDWQGEIDRAEPKLEAGDVIALCAPPREGGGDLRSSLASNGVVLCRLEASQQA